MGPFFTFYSQKKGGGGGKERTIVVHSSYQRVLYNPSFSIVFLSIHKEEKRGERENEINKAANCMKLSELNWKPGKETSHEGCKSSSFVIALAADK